MKPPYLHLVDFKNQRSRKLGLWISDCKITKLEPPKSPPKMISRARSGIARSIFRATSAWEESSCMIGSININKYIYILNYFIYTYIYIIIIIIIIILIIVYLYIFTYILYFVCCINLLYLTYYIVYIMHYVLDINAYIYITYSRY